MVSKLFLLRHGKTALAGKFAGSTDVDLSSVGIEQVQSLRPVLARERFEKIFCSPMYRCRQTARLLDLDVEISYAEDLREIDFGLWEGKDFSEIEKKNPEIVQHWIEDPEGFCFPEGECRADFILRVERFKAMLQGSDNEKVLLITHGGVIRHLICSYLGLSFEKYLLFNIHEAEFSTLECFAEGGVLTGLNKGGTR
jgi:alpha-ribazole phosphatase